ncbi:MAG: hypothetical protein GY847_29840 [Proteobacteria bacterium]|nr:hypothetical protein [Pseudomonadota bacterium]
MNITISEKLTKIARVGILRLSGIALPADNGNALWQELKAECRKIRENCAGLTSGQVPGVDEARKLYRSIGIDPTKTRPSSEALLRRIIKGKDLYRIHPLVDLFNMASLASLLPVGLYDQSKIVGDNVSICIGEEGWGYKGIRKDRVNLGGRLCVADAQGPFGSPTSDSQRTSIENQVEHAMAIFFQNTDGKEDRMNYALDFSSTLARTHLNATIEEAKSSRNNNF